MCAIMYKGIKPYKITLTIFTYEESIHWDCDVLFGDLARDEETFEVLKESFAVVGLSILIVVVRRQTVVTHDTV